MMNPGVFDFIENHSLHGLIQGKVSWSYETPNLFVTILPLLNFSNQQRIKLVNLFMIIFFSHCENEC